MDRNIEYKMRLKDILDVFVGICEKYKLHYYLSSGTLLGAVRHKGFIPWDDDIDVEMPIEDYKKFVKVAQKELGNRYFFQDYHSDKCLNVTWARIRENNTTSMPERERKFDIHYGIDIDIFPLVGIYDNAFLARIQKVLFEINSTLLQADYYKAFKHWKPSAKVKLLYSLPRRVRHLLVDINNIIVYHGFRESKTAFSTFAYTSKRNTAFFTNDSKLLFEGTMYKVPENWNGVLTDMYGDYMTPPPINKREGHEGALGKIIFDLSKSYKEYRNDVI